MFSPSDSSRSSSASLSMTSAGTVTPACWILVHTESGSRGGGPGLEATASAMAVGLDFSSQVHMNHCTSLIYHGSTPVLTLIANLNDILISFAFSTTTKLDVEWRARSAAAVVLLLCWVGSFWSTCKISTQTKVAADSLEQYLATWIGCNVTKTTSKCTS